MGTPLYGFDEQTGKRVGKSVKWYEANGQNWSGSSSAIPTGGLPTIIVMLDEKAGDGNRYSWTQIQVKSDGTWATMSGGLTGTISDRPAYGLDSTETEDFSGQPAVLARSCDSDNGDPCWIIVGPLGFTGTLTAYGKIHWDATTSSITQDTTVNHFFNGQFIKVDPTTQTTVITTGTCS